MGITLHFSYKFELNGKTYESLGSFYGDTEKEEDIKDFNQDIEDLKISAICDAFAIGFDEYLERAEEFKNAKFDLKYLEVFN